MLGCIGVWRRRSTDRTSGGSIVWIRILFVVDKKYFWPQWRPTFGVSRQYRYLLTLTSPSCSTCHICVHPPINCPPIWNFDLFLSNHALIRDDHPARDTCHVHCACQVAVGAYTHLGLAATRTTTRTGIRTGASSSTSTSHLRQFHIFRVADDGGGSIL
jgi:hypothetical protein